MTQKSTPHRTLTLPKATALAYRKYGEAAPAYCTLHRWSNEGFRGRKLGCTRIGARLFTSEADIDEFIAAMNEDPPAAGDTDDGL